MSDHKLNRLGVVENGIWKRNGKQYSHILPLEAADLNLIENYREDLSKFIEVEKIHLHQDFHHLNSSQAVCLNFFYPLIAEKQLRLLLEILHLENEIPDSYKFEKELCRTEGTKFDFYLELKSGRKLFFEIKYTEDGFGKVTDSNKYRNKYEDVYKAKLSEKIRPGISPYEALIKNYQLLRNISYVDEKKEDLLIIICPQDNSKLQKEYENVLSNVVVTTLHKNIRFFTWEAMLNDLESLIFSSNGPKRLNEHYAEFRKKYFVHRN